MKTPCAENDRSVFSEIDMSTWMFSTYWKFHEWLFIRDV